MNKTWVFLLGVLPNTVKIPVNGYKMLKKGHNNVKLSDEDMHRITVWLDSASIFYGVYEKEGGEAQLAGKVVFPTLE